MKLGPGLRRGPTLLPNEFYASFFLQVYCLVFLIWEQNVELANLGTQVLLNVLPLAIGRLGFGTVTSVSYVFDSTLHVCYTY